MGGVEPETVGGIDELASCELEQILPWLRLRSIPGVGNLICKRLLDRFGTPQGIFGAGDEDLLSVEGVTPRLKAAIRGHRLSDAVRQETDLAEANGFQIIPYSHETYPPLLRQIPDPPAYIYVNGLLTPSIKNIALVGSRNATRYGILATKRLAADLAGLGITVVSGMARGVDTAAHIGALSVGGRTVAVLGSGLTRVYPPENLKLFHRIAETGAVVSEFPLTAAPEPHHFPIRNRIISGMSLGVVIVEATKRSGSLITARLALEQNREVFAVPGNIHSHKSAGANSLIKQGAKLVEGTQDILEELSHVMTVRKQEAGADQGPVPNHLPPLSAEEEPVFRALGPDPVHIDDLVRRLSMEPGRLSGILLQLELKGVVAQSPGKLFSTDIKNSV